MNMKFIMSVCVILLMFISYHTYVHADITTTGRKGIAMSTKCTYFDPDCDNYPIEPGFVYIQPFTAPKLEDVYKGKNFMLHKGVRDASFDEINEINKEDWPKKYNKANYNAFEQYRVLRLASALQTPNMTEDAIIFVPQAATDQSKSIYKGWLGEKSFIWYTKPKSIFNDKSHMDNMVFYCANKSNTNRSIGDICNKGIYRKELEKLLTQKDKDGKITINEELHSFNEENIKELINDKTKINQSKFLWTYLTNIELEEKGNKKKYVFQANERIANFLSGAQDGSITIDDMKNFTKEDYIDYTIRYLDLCLCAYACVYDPNTEATSAKAWKELCVNYINTFRLDDGYRKLNQCHIEVGTGMISVGQYPHDNGDDQICCYIGCQNLVDIIYKLKSAGYNDKDLEKNKISVSKGFPGLWYSVSEYGLSNKYKGYENNPNVKSIWSQEELLGKTNDEIDGLNNGWLDIITTYYKSTDDEKLQSATKNYFDYYERLQHAIKNNESKNSKKKLEYPYLHKNCHIWCSRTILTRVLRTVYESANKPTSYADNLCFIEIAHQGMFNSSMKWGPYKEVDGMYGGFYLPAYHFNPPPVTPPEVDFVAFLDIKSKDLGDEKYHKGEKKSSGKNKIGKHKNVKLNVTYKEYRTKTNDEVSLQLRLKTSDAKKWEQLLSMEGVEPKITVKFTPLESLKEEKLKSTFLPLNKNKSIINYKTVPDKKDAETAGVRSIRKWLINEEPKPVLAEMDKEFLKNGMSGIQDNKKTIGYKATVEIKYKVNGKNVTITRDTNEVRVSYVSFSPITPPPSTEFITTEPPTTEIPPTPLGGTYFSNPYSYAELKDGSVYNETFEAMAGVPSTRPLYFSTGGTEFIVNLCAEYDRDQEAKRTYHSHFKETDCEYKKNDQLKELAAEQPAMIETFVADNDDEEVKTQVTAEENKAIIPKYIDTSLPNNTTVKKHNMATTFCASWSGTIRNNANMTEDGYKAPGAPCKGAESIGSEGAVNGTKTKWDVSEYKTKEIVKMLSNLNVDKKALIVLNEKNDFVVKSANNIPEVKTTLSTSLNTYDVLNCEQFVITLDAVKKLEEVYA